jgi:hypothetical protein
MLSSVVSGVFFQISSLKSATTMSAAVIIGKLSAYNSSIMSRYFSSLSSMGLVPFGLPFFRFCRGIKEFFGFNFPFICLFNSVSIKKTGRRSPDISIPREWK